MTDLERLHKLEEQGIIEGPETKRLALAIYERGLPIHQCYWNDRLYIAIRFGLDKPLQKRAVVNSVITNGRTGYFEQKTHFNFDNRGLLMGLGVPVELLPRPSSSFLEYTGLNDRVIKIVADKFEIDLKNIPELRRLQGEFYHSRGQGF